MRGVTRAPKGHLVLPHGVKGIAQEAFVKCAELTAITIPPGVAATNLIVRFIGNDREEFPGKRFLVRFSNVSGAASTPSDIEVGIFDDDMGKVLFTENFNSTANWTVASGNWQLQNGMYHHPYQSGALARGGPIGMKDYGVRVMFMMGPDHSWQTCGIGVYNRQDAGGGSGYRFNFQNNGNGSVTATAVALQVNGAAAPGAVSLGAGSTRLGVNPVLRPVFMRVTKTNEGLNRVRCWIGFRPIFDYIDTSGAILEGGRLSLSSGGWLPFWVDDIEVYANPSRATRFLVR